MSIDRWIDIEDVVHTSHRILFSPKKWNNTISSKMDVTRDCHTKWSKSERKRQMQNDISYMRNLKYDTIEPLYKTEEDS